MAFGHALALEGGDSGHTDPEILQVYALPWEATSSRSGVMDSRKNRGVLSWFRRRFGVGLATSLPQARNA